MHRTALLAAVVTTLVALPTTAAQAATSTADRVQAAIEHVPADARYGARDTTGTPLEGLKAIPTGDGRYVGLYHAQAGSRFELYVGTSANLRDWTKSARLDTDASQGSILRLSDGGFLVAYEWANVADLLPRGSYQPLSLPSPLNQVTPLQQAVITLDRVQLRFRYYPSLAALLAGRSSREFTAPRGLSKSAEGTPDLRSATLSPDLDHSTIRLGLHYRADVDGNGFPDDDREATGELTNFRTWTPTADTALDDVLAGTTERHSPYTTAPRGSHGDRDGLTVDGISLQVVEAQYRRGDFASWRLFLRDQTPGAARPLRALQPVTAGGSRSFGNPTVTPVQVGGRPALLVTAYVFGEGAAPGEPGELVYVSPLPAA